MLGSPAMPQPAGSFRPEFRQRLPGYRTPSPPRHAFEPLSPQEARPSNYMAIGDEALPKKRRYDQREAQEPMAEGHWQDLGPQSPSLREQRTSRIGPAPIDTRMSSESQPSALDIFATIATSPSLASRGHLSSFQYPPTSASVLQDRHISRPQPFERASKRSRSEVINHRPTIGYESRPVTSYLYPSPFSPSSPATAAPDSVGNSYNEHRPTEPSYRFSRNIQEDEGALRQDAELLLSISRGFAEQRPNSGGQPRNSLPGFNSPPAYVSGASTKHFRYNDPSNVTSDAYYDHYSPHQQGTNMSPGNLRPFEGNNMPLYGTTHNPQMSSYGNQAYPDGQRVLAKPKDHRGWPKGKPRGPRNAAADGKKRAKNGRKANAAGSERLSGKLKTRPSNHSRPASNQTTSIWEDNTALHVPAEVRRPRRASDTRVKRHDTELGASEDLIRSRFSSAPPNMTTFDKIESKKNKMKKEPQLNICGACKNNRSDASGLHELWINCNGCKSWFHTACAGFLDEKKVKDVDKFHCRECESQHGPTTFVRKSSRAHASVDYAGLNEGKIRTADDIPDHHYIEPIKNGSIEFLPDMFARLPPELVTQEYFERGGGWKEPVLIPAALNPRPDAKQNQEASDEAGEQSDDHSSAEPFSFDETYEYDCVPDEGQDSLDMVIPEGLTVRTVTELYGPEEKVDVIDVKLQEGEDKRWNMRQWADYYEADGNKPVRNVISLEVSQSTLGRLIRRPKIVRDLDLQDSVWPEEETEKGVFPRVQFYCLMSVADCYTDFHVDFGGSSVYYHILKGRKTFFFIPPKPKYLKKYEEWCNSPDQNSMFLGNETKECYRVDLYPGDTMLIPSGWIHAVWTPENSLVIGGNFLTRMHYGMQITVNEIEKATNVIRKFRYPYFQKILWLAVVRYLRQDPIPSTVLELLCQGHQFERKKPVYFKVDDDDDEEAPEPDDAEHFDARYYSQSEIEGLPDLVRYVYRTVIITLGKMPGITKKTQDAVMRSMPKDCGDHLEALRTFATWVAWKRGNENIPPWAYPDAPIEELDVSATEKKPSSTAQRKLERQAMHEALEAAGTRRTSLRTPARGTADSEFATPNKDNGDESVKVSKPSDGRRSACDSCRKRRRRCTHNGQEEGVSTTPGTSKPPPRFGVKMTQPLKEEEPDGNTLIPADVAATNSLTAPIITASDSVRVVVNSPSQPSWTSRLPVEQGAVDSAGTNSDMQALPRPAAHPPVPTSTTQYVSKPPKSRACEACRKSKRRCTHNPYSESSLLPVRESLVNRISSAAKRTADSPDTQPSAAKRIKRDSESNTTESTSTMNDGPATGTPSGFAEDDPTCASTVDSTLTEDNTTKVTISDQAQQESKQTPQRTEQRGDHVLPRSVPGNTQHEKQLQTASTLLKQAEGSAVEANTNAQRIHSISHTDNSNSRSRTSSLHLQTTNSSSEEANGSRSPPTSPLTDLDPASPRQQNVETLATPARQSEASISPETVPPENRHTPRQRKQVERYTDTSTTSPPTTTRNLSVENDVGKSRRTSTASSGVAGSKISGTTPKTASKGNTGSRRGSVLESPSQAKSKLASPGTTGDINRSPSAAPKTQHEMEEEEESIRLAKVLAAEDAGLRRRGGAPTKYTR